MGQAGAADQHVGRVRVVQRRQDLQVGQQGRVVVAVAQAQAAHLLRQAHAGFDGGQGQLAYRARTVHFAQFAAFHHTDATLTLTHFKLN